MGRYGNTGNQPAKLRNQLRRLSGTLPPFSASFAHTAFCNAMFCSAVPSAPTWTFNSCASVLRACKLESRYLFVG